MWQYWSRLVRERDRQKTVFWSADVGLFCDAGKCPPFALTPWSFLMPYVALLHGRGVGYDFLPSPGRPLSPVFGAWPLEQKMLLHRIRDCASICWRYLVSMSRSWVPVSLLALKVEFPTLAYDGTDFGPLCPPLVNALLPPGFPQRPGVFNGQSEWFRGICE